MTAYKKGVLSILGAALLWACLPLITRNLAVFGISAMETAAMRCYMAAFLYAIPFIKNRPVLHFSKKEWIFYGLYSLCAVVGTYVFYALAILRLSTAMAAILLYTAPAFVILFSKLLFHIPITKVKLCSLCCTLVGCFFVVRAYDPGAFVADFWGIIFGLLSGLSYASYTLFGHCVRGTLDAQTKSSITTFLAAGFFLFLVPPQTIPIPSFFALFLYVLLALIGSVLPYMLYLRGLDLSVDGGQASLMATLEPVMVTILGVLFLKESFHGLQCFGMVCTFVGIILPALAESKKRIPQ